MSRRRLLVLLFLLALAVRLPMLYFLHDAYLSGGITTSLGLVARNLLEARGLVESTGPPQILLLYNAQLADGKLLDIAEFPDPPDQPTVPLIQRMPGYPLLLAVIWRITGSYRYLPVQTLQVLLSALLPLLLYGAARRFFAETPGRLAGLLACLNLAEARLAVVPLYDWWMLFVVGVVLWLLARSMERGYPTGSFGLLGLVLAGGIYLKATLLALPFFLALFLLPRLGLRRSTPRVTLLAGLPLLALLPWAARNHHTFDRPILTNTFFWPTVWEGFGEVPNPFGAMLDDQRTYLQAINERRDLQYGTPEYDDFFRDKVLNAFESHPEFLISLWARRLVRALLVSGNPWGVAGAERPEASYGFFHAQTGGGMVAYVLRQPLIAVVKTLQRLWDPLLVLLTVLTLVVDRHRLRELLPLLAIPVAFFAATIPLHLEGRYVLPAGEVFLLFASVPLAAWIFPDRTPSPSDPDRPLPYNAGLGAP